MAFIPRAAPDWKKNALFPSVVMESGCQESPARHLEDARLWLEGSQNSVAVVLQVKFHNIDESGRISLVLSVSRTYTNALGPAIFLTNYASFSNLLNTQSLLFKSNQLILNLEGLSNPSAPRTISYHFTRRILHRTVPSINKCANENSTGPGNSP